MEDSKDEDNEFIIKKKRPVSIDMSEIKFQHESAPMTNKI